jgi:hypothetical protein
MRRGKLKLSTDGDDSGSKKCYEAMIALMVESGGRLCVGAFGGNLASVAVKMFSHLIYFIQTFCIFSIFIAICKYNLILL